MKEKTKKLLILNIPYLVLALLFTKASQAWRLAAGGRYLPEPPVRRRLRPQPGNPDPANLLYHVGTHRRHDRTLDPHHGHRAADLAADYSRNDRQYVH